MTMENEEYTPTPKGARRLIKNLSEKHKQVARYYLQGRSQHEAYAMAGYRYKNQQSLRCSASQLFRSPPFKQYLKDLREASFVENALTLAERRSVLADIVRTPLKNITDESPLAQEVTYDENGIKKIKKPSIIEALSLDSKLSGDFIEKEGINPMLAHVAVQVNVHTGQSANVPVIEQG